MRVKAPAILFTIALHVAACSGASVFGSSQPSPSTEVLALPSASATGTAAASPDLSAALDAMVGGHQDFQGSALVAQGDVVLLSKGYGLADAERNVSNTPETRFRLGSITKQFTAMAILILQSRGLLDVSDAACDHIPDCPDTWTPITIGQLLSHTSGLRNFTDLDGFQAMKVLPSTPTQTLAQIRDLPLDFAPGERFGYSNSGYVALGLIIERVTGTSYAAFVESEILEPLGMRDSGYDDGKAGLATGYRSGTTIADPIDMSVPHAAGGLYSTVLDMHRWDKALYAEKLVPPDLLATMFEPKVQGAGPGVSYGYGVGIGTYDGKPWVFHGGGIEGFVTWYGRHPDDRLAIILLANRESVASYDRLDQGITDLVLDR